MVDIQEGPRWRSQYELDTPKRDGSAVINFLSKVVRFHTSLETKTSREPGGARVHYGFVTGWGLGGVQLMLEAPPYNGHNEELVITEFCCRTNELMGCFRICLGHYQS
jgi:hypothetical protein